MKVNFSCFSTIIIVSNNFFISFQSILSVFRSIGNLEKTVETCTMSLPLSESLLIIELRCKHGIVKLYNLKFFEYEMVEVSVIC